MRQAQASKRESDRQSPDDLGRAPVRGRPRNHLPAQQRGQAPHAGADAQLISDNQPLLLPGEASGGRLRSRGDGLDDNHGALGADEAVAVLPIG